MKIYTKTGDNGKTSIANGEKIDKDDLRMELIGTIDELNATIGVARVFSRTWLDPNPNSKITRASLNSILLSIQDELFSIGAIIANANKISFSAQQKTKYWEKVIDGIDAQLPPLQHFILPGGSRVAALLHQSRAVCRRAERIAVKFSKNSPDEKKISDLIPYINRLSDLLFVLARWVNKLRKAKEIKWPIEIE